MIERDESVLRPRDWLLMFLGLPNARFETDQIRLMKGMFLLTREGPLGVRDIYSFIPYAYGPFDKAVYSDLDILEAKGLISTESEPWTNRRVYRPTESGREYAEQLLEYADPDVVAVLRRIKQRVTSLPYLQLLREIYDEYPEFAVRSRIE